MEKVMNNNELEQVTAKLNIEGVTPEEYDIKDAVPEEIKPEEGTLTEEQLDSVVATLEENRESLPVLGGVISGQVTIERGEVLEEDYIPMNADSETGNFSFAPTSEKDTEKAMQSFKDIFGASDEDMIEFLNVVKRFKSGEKFSIYNALPNSFKKVVQTVTISQGGDRKHFNTVAREFLVDQFIQNEEMNNAFDSFNKELEGLYDEIPSMADMYADTLYEAMTTDIYKKVEAVQESNPELAEKLIKISTVFRDTYEFSSIKEFISSKKYCSRVAKTRKKDKFDDEMKDFNFLLSKNNLFKWPDVTAIKDILIRKLGVRYTSQIEVFMLNLYYSRLGIDLNDVYEAEYTYYIIRNIIALDFAEGESKFNKILIGNLNNLMNYIINEFSVMITE